MTTYALTVHTDHPDPEQRRLLAASTVDTVDTVTAMIEDTLQALVDHAGAGRLRLHLTIDQQPASTTVIDLTGLDEHDITAAVADEGRHLTGIFYWAQHHAARWEPAALNRSARCASSECSHWGPGPQPLCRSQLIDLPRCPVLGGGAPGTPDRTTRHAHARPGGRQPTAVAVQPRWDPWTPFPRYWHEGSGPGRETVGVCGRYTSPYTGTDIAKDYQAHWIGLITRVRRSQRGLLTIQRPLPAHS